MEQKVFFYVISDALGETNQVVVNAAMAQFPQIKNAEIKRYPLVRDFKTLDEILQKAQADAAVLITTLVKKDLLTHVQTFAKAHQLQHLDVLADLLTLIATKTGATPIEEPGSQHKLNDSYYIRMNAINFASKYDDGKDPRGFLKADLVIIGPSRTSKTPLSMYLANQSIRVANLPLIPEVALPEELKQVDHHKIVGLLGDPNYLQKIRTTRLHFLGLNAGSSYSDIERIKAEIDYARQIMTELDVPTFDVTNQSIEETANKILEELPDLKD
ncbi:pyruvate, water dikinase regulatory protein [Agrilactobacillus yilanensis]|uniref:Putative pyruvate, phosphate dikinase regulatory protein n=1 Tax=Agrilactobacillus yilanensis TaxID=2485997 RepID=A0ABW4J4Q3_9LACO|nr:pyruvate, water dikinase regulatory protein [Agrilactobacillus yilanensis]